MTQDLYRKEALENRNRSLYGEIALRTSPQSWMVLLLLSAVTALILAALLFLQIPTESGPLPVLNWLKNSLMQGRS